MVAFIRARLADEEGELDWRTLSPWARMAVDVVRLMAMPYAKHSAYNKAWTL